MSQLQPKINDKWTVSEATFVTLSSYPLSKTKSNAHPPLPCVNEPALVNS